jgi:hypothetical protein
VGIVSGTVVESSIWFPSRSKERGRRRGSGEKSSCSGLERARPDVRLPRAVDRRPDDRVVHLTSRRLLARARKPAGRRRARRRTEPQRPDGRMVEADAQERPTRGPWRTDSRDLGPALSWTTRPSGRAGRPGSRRGSPNQLLVLPRVVHRLTAVRRRSVPRQRGIHVNLNSDSSDPGKEEMLRRASAVVEPEQFASMPHRLLLPSGSPLGRAEERPGVRREPIRGRDTDSVIFTGKAPDAPRRIGEVAGVGGRRGPHADGGGAELPCRWKSVVRG